MNSTFGRPSALPRAGASAAASGHAAAVASRAAKRERWASRDLGATTMISVSLDRVGFVGSAVRTVFVRGSLPGFGSRRIHRTWRGPEVDELPPRGGLHRREGLADPDAECPEVGWAEPAIVHHAGVLAA